MPALIGKSSATIFAKWAPKAWFQLPTKAASAGEGIVFSSNNFTSALSVHFFLLEKLHFQHTILRWRLTFLQEKPLLPRGLLSPSSVGKFRIIQRYDFVPVNCIFDEPNPLIAIRIIIHKLSFDAFESRFPFE